MMWASIESWDGPLTAVASPFSISSTRIEFPPMYLGSNTGSRKNYMIPAWKHAFLYGQNTGSLHLKSATGYRMRIRG